MEEIFLTRKEAAKLLRISQPTLFKLRASGAVKSYQVGRHVRFKKSDLLEPQALLLTPKKTTENGK